MKKNKGQVYIVVPSIRIDSLKEFIEAWDDLIKMHNARLFVIKDGENPIIYEYLIFEKQYAKDEMGKDYNLISNFNASIRNVGFYYVAKNFDLSDDDVIITLDDDTKPIGDPIQDHIDALNMRKPISWLSTTNINDNMDYMRGFPYAIREEAEVVLSHGVWDGVPDRDALSQLVSGERKQVEFYKGPIPRGIFFPFCGMNVAFKPKALPYVYYAPVGQLNGCERFDDIWGGIAFKPQFDAKNWAIVTGYAKILHNRASDPFKNLSHEYIGLKYNEDFWNKEMVSEKWFEEFRKNKKEWEKVISEFLKEND